jgi:galactokinase
MKDDLEVFMDTLGEQFIFESYFDTGVPLTVARAPGRLDVMGGIADYSGSLVLQKPIAEATFVAVQPAEGTAVRIFSQNQKIITGERRCDWRISPLDYEEARRAFRNDNHWAAYVAGVFIVLMRERGVSFPGGANILISSSVPEGKGVASSAALEVATMQAVAGAFQLSVEPRDIALLCQKAENLVAGAPCGVMDQMTSVCGEAGSLLALLCQPAELQPPVRVPGEISFWGIDSGERHAVSGSDYASVRTGAFMGYRMMCADGDRWNGYLANMSPDEFEREFRARLPEEMPGAAFLDQYGGTSDTVTQVFPDRMYKVRQAAAHPVYEHHRVRAFRDLLSGGRGEEQWTALGELMYESHASYSACGLGSRGTDLIVRLVHEEGADNGLYGARITGGGSGGTVAVVGRADAGAAIARIAEEYESKIGHRPYIFSGSSDAAASFGSLSMTMGRNLS